MSTSSTHEYADDHARLAVDLTRDGDIRLRAGAGGVGAVIDLSILGAQRLATMLGSAITTAVHRGLPSGGRD